MSYKNKKNIYFIGIGGISMSGLAKILKHKGYLISGSDITKGDTIEGLKSLNIPVNIGQREENINPSIDLIVYTSAVKADNPELVKGRALNIECIERAELLGEIMGEYPLSVAISGTHGKTTTTSMLSQILLSADVSPTLSIGGVLPSINGTTKIGNSKYFVAEACEYCDSFLKFNPYISVVLNIEPDHLDYFKCYENIENSFKKFISQTNKDGFVIVNHSIKNYAEVIKDAKAKVISFGLTSDCDYFPKDITYNEKGCGIYKLYEKGSLLGEIALGVAGEHNILNSLGAIASALCLGIDFSSIKNGLLEFKGAKRRFEYKGEFMGAKIYDDYAHHPTEIKATLKTARKCFPKREIVCIFQPHTFSRTKALMNEFKSAFNDADEIIIADIYASREADDGSINSRDLVINIENEGGNVKYLGSFLEITEYIKNSCLNNKIIITMGAGNIFIVGENLVLN